MSAMTDYSSDASVPAPAEGASAVSERAQDLAENQTPIVPDAPRDEVQRLDPDPVGPVKLANGVEVEIQPMRLRETMRLLKIITHGAGNVLESMLAELDLDDPAAFAQTFAALILFSIPDAENEVVDFLTSMCLPANFKALSQDEKTEKLNLMVEELSNPDMNDTVSILEVIVRRESEDIRALGKRISLAFSLMTKKNLIADR